MVLVVVVLLELKDGIFLLLGLLNWERLGRGMEICFSLDEWRRRLILSS